MKQTLTILFLLVSIFCAPANPPCVTRDCADGIKKIADCPDEGCAHPDKKTGKPHSFDEELDKLKNIRSDNQQPVLRSIQFMKDLEKKPKSLTECGNRDELKQLGEGQKITVVAWALTARPGSQESCNCDLSHPADTDNHIVLVDPGVKNPTLAEDEIHSVTAEFTPRVRLDHPNFTRDALNPLIDPHWKPPSKKDPKGKLLVRVTGLLMFDSKHLFEGALKRDTNWEIHPVLKMEVCPEGETCGADSDENWKDLDNG